MRLPCPIWTRLHSSYASLLLLLHRAVVGGDLTEPMRRAVRRVASRSCDLALQCVACFRRRCFHRRSGSSCRAGRRPVCPVRTPRAAWPVTTGNVISHTHHAVAIRRLRPRCHHGSTASPLQDSRARSARRRDRHTEWANGPDGCDEMLNALVLLDCVGPGSIDRRPVGSVCDRAGVWIAAPGPGAERTQLRAPRSWWDAVLMRGFKNI